MNTAAPTRRTRQSSVAKESDRQATNFWRNLGQDGVNCQVIALWVLFEAKVKQLPQTMSTGPCIIRYLAITCWFVEQHQAHVNKRVVTMIRDLFRSGSHRITNSGSVQKVSGGMRELTSSSGWVDPKIIFALQMCQLGICWAPPLPQVQVIQEK